MSPSTALLCLALAASAPPPAAGAAVAPHASTPDNALRIVTRDPPRDARHPARNRQLLIDAKAPRVASLR